MATGQNSAVFNNDYSDHNYSDPTLVGSNNSGPNHRQPTPMTNSPDRKRIFNTIPAEDEDDDAGLSKKQRRETEAPMELQGEITHEPEVGQPTPIKIKFTGTAVEQNLIYDSPTVQNLLQNSIFSGAYEGTGRAIYSKHELILNITIVTLIPDLLKVTTLTEGETHWPIEVTIPYNANATVYGVMKLHPSISDDRIRQELDRNAIANNHHGKVVTEVFRIINKHGGKDYNTWTVRLTFKGQIRPQNIFYGAESVKIMPYYPKLVICTRCSKAGHIASKCQNTYRCGICGRGHLKDK